MEEGPGEPLHSVTRLSDTGEAGRPVTDSPSCGWLTQLTWAWNRDWGLSGSMKTDVYLYALCNVMMFLWTFQAQAANSILS